MQSSDEIGNRSYTERMQLVVQFAYQDAMSSEDEGTSSEEEDLSQLDLDNLDGERFQGAAHPVLWPPPAHGLDRAMATTHRVPLPPSYRRLFRSAGPYQQ